MSAEVYSIIYTLVGAIPEGKVSTYGAIAKQAQCHARQVGYAMSQLPRDTALPWHRIVNSQGKISQRGTEGEREQRQRLLAEGVSIKPNGRINLADFGFLL